MSDVEMKRRAPILFTSTVGFDGVLKCNSFIPPILGKEDAHRLIQERTKILNQ